MNLNLEPPVGFRGLDPGMPIHYYTRRLPHLRQDGATYFATFRSADSLPQSRINELAQLRQDFYSKHGDSPGRRSLERHTREIITRIEKWLDLGAGQCQLGRPECSEILQSSFYHFDGDRYELGCFVIMPNHAHVIVRPLDPKSNPLEKVLQSWKRHSANRINQLLARSGAFWQQESFDRLIRDANHLYRAIQYIGRNPKSANRSPAACRLWINPVWERDGWGFREP